MKKMLVLLVSVLVLTACAQTKKEAKEATASKTEQTAKASSSTKEEKGLKFVVAPQFEGKTSDLIELGKKLVKEHPEAGKQGEITLYYTGSTYTLNQQEYVVFMLVNKTTSNIDHDAEFKLNWSYDGQSIYQNQLVEYRISENGLRSYVYREYGEKGLIEFDKQIKTASTYDKQSNLWDDIQSRINPDKGDSTKEAYMTSDTRDLLAGKSDKTISEVGEPNIWRGLENISRVAKEDYGMNYKSNSDIHNWRESYLANNTEYYNKLVGK